MNRISVAIVVSIVICSSVRPAVLPLEKFDSWGDICCNDEKARLDNYALALKQQPESMGYIIFYGGRQQNYPSCHSARQRLPRRGESQARAARLKPYLLNNWAIDSARVIVIDGGYRESWTAELWIVPKGPNPPTPSPTVKPQDIRFRKGVIKKRDYVCEV